MQSALRIAVSIVLLSSACAGYYSSAKLRRDGVLNLYPFPRVGRASRNTWQVPVNDFVLEYQPMDKRQLYAFPRVGRSELSLRELSKPARVVEKAGMWFGPRVGRSEPVHRDFEPLSMGRVDETDVTIQNEPNDRSEPELIEPAQQEREKRQA